MTEQATQPNAIGGANTAGHTLRLKVCGMRDSENIQQLLQLAPDFMGFIFYEKSPRNAENRLDRDLLLQFPAAVKKVGVFVNASEGFIIEKCAAFGLDYVQLHGHESPLFCQSLVEKGLHIIKAFSVDSHFDFSVLKGYEPFCDFFLFDTKGKNPGGNGEKFDWNILKNSLLQKPFFLSGGLETEDLPEVMALQTTLPLLYALDINSKFEISPGLKDILKIKRLKEVLKKP